MADPLTENWVNRLIEISHATSLDKKHVDLAEALIDRLFQGQLDQYATAYLIAALVKQLGD
jgi:hypothetical protein